MSGITYAKQTDQFVFDAPVRPARLSVMSRLEGNDWSMRVFADSWCPLECDSSLAFRLRYSVQPF